MGSSGVCLAVHLHHHRGGGRPASQTLPCPTLQRCVPRPLRARLEAFGVALIIRSETSSKARKSLPPLSDAKHPPAVCVCDPQLILGSSFALKSSYGFVGLCLPDKPLFGRDGELASGDRGGREETSNKSKQKVHPVRSEARQGVRHPW